MVDDNGISRNPFTDNELLDIRNAVQSAIEVSKIKGIHCNNAHQWLPRLLDTIDASKPDLSKLFQHFDQKLQALIDSHDIDGYLSSTEVKQALKESLTEIGIKFNE